MTTNWKVKVAEDHWLEVVDEEGWYAAYMKWDGCMGYTRYFNEPLSNKADDCDSIHICDLDDEIERLIQLRDMAKAHFKNHHYYKESWGSRDAL
jgi:hypothetical protein